MSELKNEFSWSKTRDEVFKTCPRQYWFAYYGHWNGWLEDALERTRQIYILKNLKNRHIWAGEKVHECIEIKRIFCSDSLIQEGVNGKKAPPRSFQWQQLSFKWKAKKGVTELGLSGGTKLL